MISSRLAITTANANTAIQAGGCKGRGLQGETRVGRDQGTSSEWIRGDIGALAPTRTHR